MEIKIESWKESEKIPVNDEKLIHFGKCVFNNELSKKDQAIFQISFNILIGKDNKGNDYFMKHQIPIHPMDQHSFSPSSGSLVLFNKQLIIPRVVSIEIEEKNSSRIPFDITADIALLK
jgi:hypothetical protein